MKDGNISLAREGANSKARILHAADTTGLHPEALIKKRPRGFRYKDVKGSF
jgi:aspartate oxidase